jgi:hypothetical protein
MQGSLLSDVTDDQKDRPLSTKLGLILFVAGFIAFPFFIKFIGGKNNPWVDIYEMWDLFKAFVVVVGIVTVGGFFIKIWNGE